MLTRSRTSGRQKKVREECGVLIYKDKASFGQAGSLHRTWAKRGQGKSVKSFPGGKSVKVIGAVRVGEQPGWHFRFVERFNADTFLAFIEQLLRYYSGKKIKQVVDKAPRHKTKGLRRWLMEIKHLIEVHFLRKYWPKLNAAEYIGKETRKWASHNRFFGALKDLKDSLFRRFNRFQGDTGTLRTLVPYFA